MATEKNLTEEFFRVFGIEPHRIQTQPGWYPDIIEEYPDITVEKLLEMICICNSTYINGYTNYFISTGKTKEELKEEILKKCITLSKDIKQQIQQIFKD